MSDLIVTIDGPGGTGKSTVSRALALRLDLPHLDTGAFYRAATLAVLQQGIDPLNQEAVESLVGELKLTQSIGRMFLDGHDVSEEIRGEEVTAAVSAVSAYAGVRAELVEMQRDWAADKGSRGVIEGRDIGSVVFPDAQIKFYLDARPEVRALRRARQSGENIDDVLEDLARRDGLDSRRDVSPMSVPDGGVVVDTSDLTQDEVVDRLADLVAGIC